MEQAVSGKPRIAAIDIARGAALLAMAVYHLGWDLEFFGYMEPGTTVSGVWRLFARSIATSFLFLVGVSLFLAHAERVRWPGFGKRLAMVAGAAALITAATWFAFPEGFIFFGILHHIALASLVGLAFLRLPAWLVLAGAAAAVAAPHFLRSPLFDHPALWWVGLSSVNPHANDYVPFLPWFGAVLAGIAAARIARDSGILTRLATLKPGRWSTPLTLAGRHSLAFYLLHQPVLIACVWGLAQVWPAAQASPETRFTQACAVQCGQSHDEAFCRAYCTCFTGVLAAEDRLEAVFSQARGLETETRLSQIASECTMQAEGLTASERDQADERP